MSSGAERGFQAACCCPMSPQTHPRRNQSLKTDAREPTCAGGAILSPLCPPPARLGHATALSRTQRCLIAPQRALSPCSATPAFSLRDRGLIARAEPSNAPMHPNAAASKPWAADYTIRGAAEPSVGGVALAAAATAAAPAPAPAAITRATATATTTIAAAATAHRAARAAHVATGHSAGRHAAHHVAYLHISQRYRGQQDEV